MLQKNSIDLIGYAGSDSVVSVLKDGTSVVNFTIATNYKYKTASGEIKENTSWHKIEVWNEKHLEIASEISKGDGVIIEGRIKYKQVPETPYIQASIVPWTIRRFIDTPNRLLIDPPTETELEIPF